MNTQHPIHNTHHPNSCVDLTNNKQQYVTYLRCNATFIGLTFVSFNNNKMVVSTDTCNIQICLSISNKPVGSYYLFLPLFPALLLLLLSPPRFYPSLLILGFRSLTHPILPFFFFFSMLSTYIIICCSCLLSLPYFIPISEGRGEHHPQIARKVTSSQPNHR